MSKLLRNTVTTLVIALVASIVFVQPSLVSAEQGIAGYSAAYPLQATELTLGPSFSYEDAAHVANGIAMRNRIEGTIHLRGIPAGATILKAVLYVTIVDKRAVGLKYLNVIFNGNLAGALNVADSLDPCWGYAGTHTYRLHNVLPYIPKDRPNQDYEVTLALPGFDTSGQDPWQAGAGAKRLLEGATLIVVYSTASTGGTVYIYDAFNNSMFSSVADFFLNHPVEGGRALFTMTGADGQRSNPYGTSFFNGTQIAGPGAEAFGGLSASDWNGMAGWPLSQLWDVQTHYVDVAGGTSTVSYNAVGDCVVPAAMVLDMQ